MNRFSSNFSLLIISLILAIGLVSIKAQEQIDMRIISGIQVTVENLPPNMLLPPEPWIAPMVSATIQGPQNFIDFVRADKASFRIDFTNIPTPETDNTVTVLLDNDMFKTNLDPQDSSKISVVEDAIRPRQVVLRIFPWDIEEPLPELTGNGIDSDRVFIPILKIQKDIPVVVPTSGSLPEGYVISDIEVEPSVINVTGRRDAVDRIKSVSTTPLALDFLQTDDKTQTLLMSLEGFGDMDVKPMNETVRNVTATVHLSRSQ